MQWNSSYLWVSCPFCATIHTHSFGAGYYGVIRIAPCRIKRVVYLCSFPFQDELGYELDKEMGIFFSSKALPDRNRHPAKALVPECTEIGLFDDGQAASACLLLEQCNRSLLCALVHQSTEYCFALNRRTSRLRQHFDKHVLIRGGKDDASLCTSYLEIQGNELNGTSSVIIQVGRKRVGLPQWKVWVSRSSDSRKADQNGPALHFRGVSSHLALLRAHIIPVVEVFEDRIDSTDLESQVSKLSLQSAQESQPAAYSRGTHNIEHVFRRSGSQNRVIPLKQVASIQIPTHTKTIARLERGYGLQDIDAMSGRKGHHPDVISGEFYTQR